MSLVAIAYTSTVVRPLDAEQIDAILSEARDYNRRANVTGALLHHAGSFFQYIEGPPESVEDVYGRIRASRRHADIVEFMHGEIDARQFSRWYMAFAEAPPTLMQRLAGSEWDVVLPSLGRRVLPSPGLALLLDFWARAAARPAGDAPGDAAR